MIINYLKTSWRNLWHNKTYGLINISGLTLGLTAFLLITLYVMYERSYDKFHVNKEHIFRVNYKQFLEGKLEVNNAAAVPAVGPAMKENFPEVLEYTRLTTLNSIIVSYGNRTFREEKILAVDPSFLTVFTFPLVKGDGTKSLSEPNTGVITESMAKKYFGYQDPIGKVLTVDRSRNVQITGVCRDVPSNSHMKFDLLISMEKFYGSKQQNARWYWYDFYTYVLIKPGTDPDAFESSFNTWISKRMRDEWKDQGLRQQFELQSVTGLHLHSDRMQELEPAEQGDSGMVTFLIIIGVLILTIAWANYINLNTCHAVSRAKEIGVRKVIGASKNQLLAQFLTESTLLNLSAAICAFILLRLGLPYFEQMIGHPLNIQRPVFSGLFIISVVAGSIISGLYPAFVIAQFKPATAIKGFTLPVSRGFRLRQSLVIFQFTISIVLIVGALTIYKQLMYLRSKDIGANLDQTLIVNTPQLATDSLYTGSIQSFKTELQRLVTISRVTISSSVPGREIGWMNTITPVGLTGAKQNENNSKAICIVGIDSVYISSYGIKLLAGHDFLSSTVFDKENTVLLNRAGTQLLGYATPAQSIGQRVDFRGKNRVVIGVVDNYNHVSPKEAVIPIVFTYQPYGKGFFSIKLSASEIRETIEQVKRLYHHFFPSNPFDYYFLDDAFNQQFKADLQFGKIFSVFTGLAIFVACMGLFALAAFAAQQRRKEIGIRKVLGAGVPGIVTLLSKDFLKLVVIANLIALPLSWWAMNIWLQDFAYRIQIGWEIFVVGGITACLVAWITVGSQAIKVAAANPVKSLRSE